ncbi:unnamed protein product, partial [Hapterophycus canaliculatus]
ERWANACVLSGDCIAACKHGVNPRLLLSMARVAQKQKSKPAKERRQEGGNAFKRLASDVRVLSQIQLSDIDLSTLIPSAQQSSEKTPSPPEVVFYTGCNVLKTPHIALLCIDILELLGVNYVVQGGPKHCCGILQVRAGDIDGAGRMGSATLEKFITSGASRVLTWCPSCFVNFTETIIPSFERVDSKKALDMTPFVLYLLERLEDIRPHLVHRTPLKVALHAHRGV